LDFFTFKFLLVALVKIKLPLAGVSAGYLGGNTLRNITGTFLQNKTALPQVYIALAKPLMF
jgi:hypothetical protein